MRKDSLETQSIRKGGTTKLIIGRPLSVRIRPLECASVRCPSRLFGLSVRSADGQMRTDSGRMRTDSGRTTDGCGRTADGQRTDGTHTAHGQCSFVTIDNLSISLDPLFASGRTADGCGQTAEGQWTDSVFGARTIPSRPQSFLRLYPRCKII